MDLFTTIARCPDCGGSLDSSHTCPCGFRLMRDEQNIYRLTKNKDHYFREKMPRDLLQRINVAKDFQSSAYHAFKDELQWQYDFYALDANRGAGTILSKLDPDALVLDFGAGWGNLSKFASQFCLQVFAIDLTYESLLFSKRSAPENKITYIHGGDGKFLPFADHVLDVVFLNGVLEWMPVYDLTCSPRDVQLRFLKEVRRVLKPNGQILVGIENRMGFRYFLGQPDEHTKIKFATVLPRVISNLVSKWKYKRQFRNYTYTRWGYRHLLREAGFVDVGVHIPYQNYREIYRIYFSETVTRQSMPPFGSQSKGWKKIIKEFAGKLLFSTGLIRYFAHAFLVRSNNSGPNLLRSVLAAHGEDEKDVVSILNQSHKGIVSIETSKTLYKLPAHQVASKNLTREKNTVDTLRRLTWMGRYLPKMELLHIADADIQIITKSSTGVRDVVYRDHVLKFLEMKAATSIDCVLADVVKHLRLDPLHEHLQLNGKEAWLSQFLDRAGQTPIRAVFAHGDFHTDNILPVVNGISIIDWKFFSELAPIEFDVFDLGLREEMRITGSSFSGMVDQFLSDSFRPSLENTFVDILAHACAAHLHVKIVYCLHVIASEMGRYEHVTSIPFERDRKYRMILSLIEKRAVIS